MKTGQGQRRRARKAWRKAHEDQGPMLAGESPRSKRTTGLRSLLWAAKGGVTPDFGGVQPSGPALRAAQNWVARNSPR